MKQFDRLQTHLLSMTTPSYSGYYNGDMSYRLYGKKWKKYVEDNFDDVPFSITSENVFKTAVDLYAEALMPQPNELQGFSDTLIPLITRGQAPVIVDKDGVAHFPERFKMLSDSTFTVTAVFSRSLVQGKDYITFVYSDGQAQVWSKPIPEDFSSSHTFSLQSDSNGYQLEEESTGNRLFRFALNDRGIGSSLASLQDRVNHSILDQTIIAEMYARPFWYLLNAEIPLSNPYDPQGGAPSVLTEEKTSDASGRIITTSADGPFGQLTPPTLGDMVAYHDTLLDKVSQTTGIPQFFFKPGNGTPPTGIALMVLSKRFNNKVSRMRRALEPQLQELASLLGVKPGTTGEIELWAEADDTLQESLDSHGLALVQMGYPLRYVAEVVTPGVDLDKYADDGLLDSQLNPFE